MSWDRAWSGVKSTNVGANVATTERNLDRPMAHLSTSGAPVAYICHSSIQDDRAARRIRNQNTAFLAPLGYRLRVVMVVMGN